MKIFVNNALLHPIRAAKIAFRRMFLNLDNKDPLWDGGAVPPALQRFQPGEMLPWKGVQFRVGKVVGGDFPMLILVPAGMTNGEKLRRLRGLRDVARGIIADEKKAKEAACLGSKAS